MLKPNEVKIDDELLEFMAEEYTKTETWLSFEQWLPCELEKRYPKYTKHFFVA